MRALVAATVVATTMAWAPSARAECNGDPNQEPCGTDFCIPAGHVCCDSVGHPELSCPPGNTCRADGNCTAPCTAPQTMCGNGCIDADHTCCADVGHPELSCPASHICTAEGTCMIVGDGKTGGCAAADPEAGALLALGLGLLVVPARRRRTPRR